MPTSGQEQKDGRVPISTFRWSCCAPPSGLSLREFLSLLEVFTRRGGLATFHHIPPFYLSLDGPLRCFQATSQGCWSASALPRRCNGSRHKRPASKSRAPATRALYSIRNPPKSLLVLHSSRVKAWGEVRQDLGAGQCGRGGAGAGQAAWKACGALLKANFWLTYRVLFCLKASRRERPQAR